MTDFQERKNSISTVQASLGDRSYKIMIGKNLIEESGNEITKAIKHPRVIIITDSNVAPLYLDHLQNTLSKEKIEVQNIILNAGEATKSFSNFKRLLDQCLDAQITRDTTLIALGGGVIGDITGFAASVLLRGIQFIQIPTTLLAQVDSSVGGKTGINTKHGKNLIGSFYQPSLVIADISTLSTLPQREIRAGYSEVVKYGLINDVNFFDWLEKNGKDLCNNDQDLCQYAVKICCEAKSSIVTNDELETGSRALLNLGHTFAHAFEAESNYSNSLLHGEAVSVGMVLAFQLSHDLGLCPKIDLKRIKSHLLSVNLPISLTSIAKPSWTADNLMAHMKQDKKILTNRLSFIISRGIGKAFISRDINLNIVRELLKRSLVS